uniref:Uncharacterized protein n=1 Tax=Arion vulgaris TaxID=1028688 RepID=A0A0B6ZNM2_9EUPU
MRWLEQGRPSGHMWCFNLHITMGMQQLFFYAILLLQSMFQETIPDLYAVFSSAT